MALVKMRQGREETLKAFMDWFNQTVCQVTGADLKLIINTITTALRPGPFVDSIYAEEHQTLTKLQSRPARFIKVEEM